MTDRGVPAPFDATPLAQPASPPLGRLTVLSAIAGAAGALPVPILPTRLLYHVRGALVHDVASRHGLSLEEDGRAALAEPTRFGRRRAHLATAALFLTRRVLSRFTVLAVVPPIASWIEIYALGLLFDRYLTRVRETRAVRISWSEAREARTLIDRSLRRFFSSKIRGLAPSKEPQPSEELRDAWTRVYDGVLLGLAAIPQHAQRRLEAAFDLVVEEMKGERRG